MIERFAHQAYLLHVQSLKTLFVLLLALAWVPMTAHCSIELNPGFGFLECATDASKGESKNHCGDTGCCTFENGAYKTETSKPTCPPVAFVALFYQLVLLEHQNSLRLEPTLLVLAIPPELPQSWQFISRTALPVRAPSIAS
ncbi:MAG: hypothetical protein ABS95_03075 [Verrucomicrobia bacterium SCN 57-15]|nr:MAG: hypothetical protein ABS95_03075 [Verrucomicrobia bacterium SCN 57-15]